MRLFKTNEYIHKLDKNVDFKEQIIASKTDKGDYELHWQRRSTTPPSETLDELKFKLPLDIALYIMNGWENDQLYQLFGNNGQMKANIYNNKKSCDPQHYSHHSKAILGEEISPLKSREKLAPKILAALEKSPLKTIYGAELHMISDNPDTYICPENAVILSLAEYNEEDTYSIISGQRLSKFDDGAESMVATCRSDNLKNALDALHEWEYSSRHKGYASHEKETGRPLHYRQIAALIGHEFPLPKNVLAFKSKNTPDTPKI